jgi:hypothetical protein
MDYEVLWIVSLSMTLIYCGCGGTVFVKYRRYLDPFMKSNITIYFCAFVAKTFFWLASYELELYNNTIP